MPTYTYRCTECEYLFDIIQGIREDALEECPECTKNTLQKVLSAANFIFKGTGFYKTDYKKKS